MTGPRRVLQVHNDHQEKGGALEVLQHEGELLAGHGHQVEQFILPATADLGLSPVRAGLKAVWNLEASAELARRITRFRPDVVHVHTPFPLLSPAVFRTAAKLGVPSLTTLHSFRYSCVAATCFRDGGICEDCVGKRLKLPGVRHRCYHDSLAASGALTLSLALHRGIGTFHRSVTRFITLTGFSRRLLIRDGIPAEKVIVKANSVPDPGPPSGPDTASPYVAFAGRLLDVKGVRTLLDAWPQVGGGTRLRIAGDGPLRELVQERARTEESIEYLGWVDEEAVTALMAGAAAVVVPSEWYEGLPLVILRSLSVGTPLVVSDLENISEELLADHAGAAFAVGDPIALARVLRGLLADPDRLLGMRRAARASYQLRYSPAVNLAALENIYAAVVRTAE
ncbi:glycosyltransferase [soil metagenome]